MYFSTMNELASDPFRACTMQLSILVVAMVRQLSRWDYTDLSAPYWRLYYNGKRGAHILHGDRSYDMDPRQLTLIAPGTPFTRFLASPVDHFYIHFTLTSHAAPLNGGIYQFEASESDIRRIAALSGQLRSNPSSYLVDLAGHELTARALTRVPLQDWLQIPTDGRVQKAMELIRQNQQTGIGNEEIAGAVNMSVNGFIRLFSKHTGMSPQQYSLRVRLDRAGIMLHHTDKSIDAIAEECGFCDRNYFTRIFKKHRSMTPGRFRRLQRG
jgi:AraC-like DNA-binding protein